MNKDILYYIWLVESFSYGSLQPSNIVKQVHNLPYFHKNLISESKRIGLKQNYINRLKSSCPNMYTGIIRECEKLGISIVCYSDDNYPEKLKNINSPPVVLYYVGDLSVFSKPSVAVVGTRKADLYYLNVARKISEQLSYHDILVVSGCAEGIDTQAHRGALDVNGKTVAVLGTSIDKNYPIVNSALKRKIINAGGIIISEYKPKTETAPWMFPVRNRLIVGLSDNVIIVQSPKKSGAMITARIALDFGRELFCVPPSDIYNTKNDGVKQCLKDGANLFLDIDDILSTYKFSKYVVSKKPQKLDRELNSVSIPPELMPVFQIINQDNSLDDISRVLHISVSKLLIMLTQLEIIGAIEKVGSHYRKCDKFI